MMNLKKDKLVTIVDLWTDDNRGDAALQISLVKLIRKRFDNHKVIGVYRFGFNEISKVGREVCLTSGYLDNWYGSAKATNYAGTTPFWYRVNIFRKIFNLFSVISYILFMSIYLIFRQYSYFFLPSNIYKMFRSIDNAEVVIWKGKNFRVYPGFTAVTRALSLTLNILPAIFMKKRIWCVNASFWNLENCLSRNYYSYICNKCEHIIVREPASIDNLKKISPSHKSVTFSPDLSFELMREYRYIGQNKSKANSNISSVALTITDWGSDKQKENYLRVLCQIVQELKYLGARNFIIVPQVIRLRELNKSIVDDLIKLCRQKDGDIQFEVVDKSLSIVEILEVYSRTRLLIGTRMHSCVFSRTVNTPFLAIAYDEGPKWDILSSIWPSKFINDYSTLSWDNDLLNQIHELWKQGDYYIENTEEYLNLMFMNVSSNLPS